jgi:ribonuclease BN (tRNA processing enzyme)
MEQAVEVARAGNVDELILAHHAPQRGDEQINTMLETQRQMHPDMHLHAAYAGMILTREHDHAG